MNFGPATPILRILDEARAREFYVDFLGFTIDFEHRFEPGTPIYMGLSLGACKLHLSEHHGDGIPGANVRIHCDEVEELRTQLLAKRYKYARPGIQDMEWGAREVTIGDPFGNRVTFWKEIPT